MSHLLPRLALFGVLSISLLAADSRGKTPPNYNIPLWSEGKVPLALGTAPLDAPFVTVFQPPEGKRNGASIVIAPGGSNIMLMYGCEGIEIADTVVERGRFLEVGEQQGDIPDADALAAVDDLGAATKQRGLHRRRLGQQVNFAAGGLPDRFGQH